MSVEHLNILFLGGNRDDAFKKEVLGDYVKLLNKRISSDLTDNQKNNFTLSS